MKKLYKMPTTLAGTLFVILCGFGITAKATIFPFHNTYSGAQEVPPNASTAVGTIVGTYNDVTNTISFTIIFSGLSAPTNNAHFHGPAAVGVGAGVTIAHTGFPLGVTAGTYSASNVLTDAQETELLAGLWYSNIHTVGPLAAGEIRAQIILGNPVTTSPFINTYSGAQEVPPNNSTATGTILGTYNHSTNTISFSIIFAGLSAPTNNAHFHGPGAVGVGAGVTIAHAGFPLGVTEGFYSAVNALTDQQETELLAGLWYSNIHSVGPLAAGEIRAQILLMDILPPTLSDPTVDPSSLWPPNNKMEDVEVSYSSSDNFPGDIECQLTVASNEASGEPADWIVVDENAVQLRAERNGNGSGRVYTITVTCTDAQGNSSSKSTTVTVPHSNSETIVRLRDSEDKLSFRIFPNPTNNYFNINIQSKTSEKINLRLIDMLGRTIESRNNLAGNQVIRIGGNLSPGIYYMELRQGSDVKQLKLVKLDN
jgi:CHRD domain/Secretion system C-terminal sorting domain